MSPSASQPPRPDSWSRSFSNTHLPQLPNVSGLRAALLGYLGEVEQALRNKIGDQTIEGESHGFTGRAGAGTGDSEGIQAVDQDGESTGMSSDELEADRDGVEGSVDTSMRSLGGTAMGLEGGPSSTLRYRSSANAQLQTNQKSDTPSTTNTTSTNTTTTNNHDPNLSLLQHLSTVREDVRAYLPNRISLPAVPTFPSIPHMPALPLPPLPSQLNREWLRSLPGKLSVVDLGVSPSPSDPASTSDKGKGKARATGDGEDHHDSASSVELARKKVIDLVHALLPSEDWAGWEKLGWEEQDPEDDGAEALGMRRPVPVRSRSHSVSLAVHQQRQRQQARRRASERYVRDPDNNDGEDEDDVNDNDNDEKDDTEEPEYLFPNMTPASAHAKAVVRGGYRSRSKSFTIGMDQSDSYFQFAPQDDVHDSKANDRRRLGSSPTRAQMSRRSTGLRKSSLASQAARDDEELVDEDVDIEHAGPSRNVGLEDADGERYGEGDEAEDVGLDDGEVNVATEGLLGGDKGQLDSPDMGPTLAEALKLSDDGKRLITYDDLPFWWRNNEHIVTGYRFIPLHAKTGPIPLIKSAFTWHNETVNIHSHFVPTIMILLVIPLIIYSSPLPSAHPLDTTILVLYLIAAVSCLSSSASWHVLSGCASLKWFEWGACVDYIGISWLIAASFGTVVYNGFYCQPKTVLFYCSTNALCGALGSYLPFQRWFNERRHKNWRIAFFLFLNFAMVAPIFQMCFQHGYARALTFGAPFGRSILAYVAGLLFYAFHFPEVVWPGKFDYWFQSHQLWHFAIVFAIYLHYCAIFQAHSARYDYSCAVPGAGEPVGVVVEGLMRGLREWFGWV